MWQPEQASCTSMLILLIFLPERPEQWVCDGEKPTGRAGDCCEQLEGRCRPNGLRPLGQVQLARIQQGDEGRQHVGRGQVDVLDHQPLALGHCLHGGKKCLRMNGALLFVWEGRSVTPCPAFWSPCGLPRYLASRSIHSQCILLCSHPVPEV